MYPIENVYLRIKIISEYDILIGVHGNGLTHLTWIGDTFYGINKTMLIELLPPKELKINDFMLQSELSNINIHFQWDTFKGEIRSGSFSFDLCPLDFYQCNNYPNHLITEFKNMNKLFDIMQRVWIDEMYYHWIIIVLVLIVIDIYLILI